MEELSQPVYSRTPISSKPPMKSQEMKQMYKQQTSEPHNKFPIPMSSLAIYSLILNAFELESVKSSIISEETAFCSLIVAALQGRKQHFRE